MEESERRRYFRIEDDIIFHCTPITAEVRKRKELELNMNQIDYPDPDKFYLMLESDLNMVIQNLKIQNIDCAKAITLLNRKLNLIASQQRIGMRLHLFDKEPQKVNISACGMAFSSTEPYTLNQSLLVEFLLLPQKSFIQCVGEVVSADPEGDHFQINIDFNVMREEDREQLIQHIVQREMMQIQMRKKQQTLGNGTP